MMLQEHSLHKDTMRSAHTTDFIRARYGGVWPRVARRCPDPRTIVHVLHRASRHHSVEPSSHPLLLHDDHDGAGQGLGPPSSPTAAGKNLAHLRHHNSSLGPPATLVSLLGPCSQSRRRRGWCCPAAAVQARRLPAPLRLLHLTLQAARAAHDLIGSVDHAAAEPPTTAVVLQLHITLGAVAARLHQGPNLITKHDLEPLVLSLVLAPLATGATREGNSPSGSARHQAASRWATSRRDGLQSTIPIAFGLRPPTGTSTTSRWCPGPRARGRRARLLGAAPARPFPTRAHRRLGRCLRRLHRLRGARLSEEREHVVVVRLG